MPSAFQFCSMGVKRGCYTVITSELLKPSTFDVCKGFSAYVGGTKSHISRFAAELTAAPWSAQLCRDSCNGLVTSSKCHPTASLDVFYMDSSPMASACLRGGPKKCFSDHLKAILKKCHISFDQLEVLAMDRITWRDACQDGLSAYMTDLNQAAEYAGMRSPTRLQVVHAVPHATKFVLLTSLRSHLRSHRT